MRINRLLAWCLCGVFAFALIACGNQEPTAKAEDKQPTQKVEEADERQVFGEESKDAFEVSLTNGLSGDITSLSVRMTGEQNYPSNLMDTDATFKKDEQVRLFVQKAEVENATYDIRVTVEGVDEGVEFLNVPLGDAVEVKLLQGEGVAYVDYIDAKGGKASTKEAALERKKAADEAQAQADAEAAKAESESTAAQESTAAAQAPVTQDSSDAYTEQQSTPEPVYTEEAPSSQPETEPVLTTEPVSAPVETPNAPEQTEDACAGDIMLRY